MAEWVALPSISGGPRGPFRDLRGPGKGMVGGDWGPDQGAAEQPLPRGFPSRSPGGASPRGGRARLASPARGRARSPTTGPCPLPPRCTADPAAALGLTPSPASFPGEAASPRTKLGTHPLPAPGFSLSAPSPAAGLQAEGRPRLLGQRWDDRAGCPSFPVALLSQSQRAVQ